MAESMKELKAKNDFDGRRTLDHYSLNRQMPDAKNQTP